MQIQKFPLSPPSLEEIAEALKAPLAANFAESSVSVVTCPDLRDAPFHLAAKGLSGHERIADVGGQPNLFPRPRLENKWSMTDLAIAMDMDPEKGCLIGAGAGPFHVIGQNCELAPNLSWQDGHDHVRNETRYAKISRESGDAVVEKSPSVDCGLMINLFGARGETGPVLKITAKKRRGSEKSFAECVRKGLQDGFGDSNTVSLGGVFLIRSGRTTHHIMPDFPPEEELPFRDAKQLNDWLTYHDFDGPIVCLSVMHSADPGKAMGLRMEHTHCFSSTGENEGGHYHYDVDGFEDLVEYEAYFNTAKVIYRIDKPTVTLERDLHD